MILLVKPQLSLNRVPFLPPHLDCICHSQSLIFYSISTLWVLWGPGQLWRRSSEHWVEQLGANCPVADLVTWPPAPCLRSSDTLASTRVCHRLLCWRFYYGFWVLIAIAGGNWEQQNQTESELWKLVKYWWGGLTLCELTYAQSWLQSLSPSQLGVSGAFSCSAS